MNIYEAAQQALRDIGKPTHLRTIYAHIVEKGYFQFGAVDPIRALGVQIDRHSKGVLISKPAGSLVFYRDRPATYGLLEWLDKDQTEDLALDGEIQQDAELAELDASLFLEQELQRWLFKNWEKTRLTALEFGPLELFAPDEQLRKSGKFDTGVVGEIDFLFRTPSDDLLICELKRSSTDQTVGQICRYLGWAMETIGKGRRVHGLILARDITESLRFALKATNDNISCRELVLDVTLGPSFR